MTHVHIICRNYTEDRIIPRLARDLAEGTGWTLGDRPDPTARLNYFFPYLEWERFQDFKATPSAAWFTHIDTAQPGKVSIWDQAAQAVDLRLTSARQYADQLATWGPTGLVTPPLDRTKFTLAADKPATDKPVVGVSGFVYPGGRKGESLIQQLQQNNLADLIHLRASGQGWPVTDQKLWPWERMEVFFQGLDVYLCTAEIEGVPYPPLEALACGVKVVIPRGVGLLDQLPDAEGIFRYKAGNFRSLLAALKKAIASPWNRRELRSITARFTPLAWATDHDIAVDKLFNPHPPVVQTANGGQGFFYVAYGDPARACAERAIASVKVFMPETPVALVSDQPLGAEDIFIEHPDSDIGARSVKTQIYDLAPADWERIIYLDADTELIADVSFLFDLLKDGWESFFCYNPAQYVLAREMKRPDNGDECEETFELYGTDNFVQLNGGVFGFRRCPATEALFRAWHTEWQRHGRRDQAALDRALWAHPLRLITLGNEWNTVTRYIDAERSAGILHYPMTARRWRGLVNGRLDSDEAWARVHPGG